VEIRRLRVKIQGAVQGVGFRPYVYRLACSLGLNGWVNNSPQGVVIEIEGSAAELESFLLRIEREKPPHSSIHSLQSTYMEPAGYPAFEIRRSEDTASKTAIILPDIAACPDCLREMSDPADRRYRYPFTNCTHCGPRFSIIEALPYDRPNTSMKVFDLCDECRAEYNDPADRRFHAQPNACSACGPHLELWAGNGNVLATHDDALQRAADSIRAGRIIAVKGLGGFHLVVDARNDEAVQRLRRRKRREEKPLAIMVPSLDAAQQHCDVSPLEERLLRSAASPIVLMRRRQGLAAAQSASDDAPNDGAVAKPLMPARHGAAVTSDGQPVAESVAPDNPYLGVMLPYTPLHHLLMIELGFAIVATSGNLSDEPICIDETEAVGRLGAIADLFLVHNRPVVRHMDDSIARIVGGRDQILRRARGYAPLPFALPEEIPPALAVGAHLKDTVALSVGRHVFVSQHIGDLETDGAHRAFEKALDDLQRLYDAAPKTVLCDAHPDYLSTKYARWLGIPVQTVQHHLAHVLACMIDNELEPPLLGVSWDGTGYGPDGTVWGGEFFRVDEDHATRVAHLRTFPLPGGDQAVREPRRSALGLLFELGDDALFDRRDLPCTEVFSIGEMTALRTMMAKRINSPGTSSAGRLFDAVASLIGLRHTNLFEGQAAMALEHKLVGVSTEDKYRYRIREGNDGSRAHVVDWEPMVREIIEDWRAGVAPAVVSARFHNTLVEIIINIARMAGLANVVLTGGCFQNKYLTETSITRLEQIGLKPFWHQRTTPNDGGIALGQIAAALRKTGFLET
jgi:hydrogenase maturation protein HypF